LDYAKATLNHAYTYVITKKKIYPVAIWVDDCLVVSNNKSLVEGIMGVLVHSAKIWLAESTLAESTFCRIAVTIRKNFRIVCQM
jgi:hypothetical protein